MLDSTRLPHFVGDVIKSPHLTIAIAYLVVYWNPMSRFCMLLASVVALDLLVKLITAPVPLKRGAEWKIVIVGAGPAGLCMAKRLLDVGVDDFLILEKSDSVGGTWYYNRYPGCASDIPPHYYSFSFHMNPWWTHLFVEGSELYAYLKDLAETFGLLKYVRYNNEVNEARWDKTAKMWTITTKNGHTYKANFLIRATSIFHFAKSPTFKGEENYKNEQVHSLHWHSNVNVDGKKVAVIGTGASGVQIVPNIADKVSKLYLFQRNPVWSPMKKNYKYYEWMKVMFYMVPWTNQILRYAQFWYYEFVHHFMLKLDSRLFGFFEKMTRDEMKEIIGDDKELQELLIPKYAYGCKRAAASNAYLQTFKRPHVKCVTSTIDHFTENGIRTEDGNEYEIDLVIKATGFDNLKSMKSFDTYGEDEKTKWGDMIGIEPRSYKGCSIPGFPNFFIIFGPNTGASHVSMFYTFECSCTYIIDCIRQLEKAEKESMVVKDEVYQHAVANVKWYMRNKTYDHGSCISNFMNEEGVGWVLYPRDLVTYWWEMLSCKASDYLME